MLRNVPVSRKSFIASAIALCALVASPKQSKAEPLDVEFSSPEEYIEAINESGAGWTTYALNPEGEMYVVAQFEHLAINDQEYETRGIGQWIVKIAVYVGKALKGYVEGLVIDGIIKQITGKLAITGSATQPTSSSAALSQQEMSIAFPAAYILPTPGNTCAV